MNLDVGCKRRRGVERFSGFPAYATEGIEGTFTEREKIPGGADLDGKSRSLVLDMLTLS